MDWTKTRDGEYLSSDGKWRVERSDRPRKWDLIDLKFGWTFAGFPSSVQARLYAENQGHKWTRKYAGMCQKAARLARH